MPAPAQRITWHLVRPRPRPRRPRRPSFRRSSSQALSRVSRSSSVERTRFAYFFRAPLADRLCSGGLKRISTWSPTKAWAVKKPGGTPSASQPCTVHFCAYSRCSLPSGATTWGRRWASCQRHLFSSTCSLRSPKWGLDGYRTPKSKNFIICLPTSGTHSNTQSE